MRKRKKSAFHKNLEVMTSNRLKQMVVLDSDNKRKGLRLLQDPTTGLHLVFSGKFNQAFYAKSYQAAERFFLNKLAKHS